MPAKKNFLLVWLATKIREIPVLQEQGIKMWGKGKTGHELTLSLCDT